jgi:hypothetical protein
MNTVLVKAVLFNSTSKSTIDKNGKQAIMLIPIAGKVPNRNVIAGTLAEREGFVAGNTYLAQYRQTESNAYGVQYQWTKLSEVNPLEIVALQSTLGNAEIFQVKSSTSTIDIVTGEVLNPNGI